MDANAPTVPFQASTPSSSKRGSAHIRYDHCKKYDLHRRPIGMRRLARWMTGAAKRHSRAMSETRVASFCCGTGQNENELLDILEGSGGSLGHLLCADASDGMLASVAPKLASHRTPVDTRVLDVVKDDFALDGRLDVALCIQATQHLDRRDEHYRNVRLFFEKTRRALVPGGSLFLIISTPDQVREPHWFMNVMSGLPGVSAEEDPAEHFAREHAELHTIVELLDEVGFSTRRHRTLSGPHFRRESYFGDPRIVQTEEFRHASSFFWIAKERGLLERYDEVLAEKIDDGTLEDHRERCEERRRRLGVSCLIEAVSV